MQNFSQMYPKLSQVVFAIGYCIAILISYYIGYKFRDQMEFNMDDIPMPHRVSLDIGIGYAIAKLVITILGLACYLFWKYFISKDRDGDDNHDDEKKK